MSLSMMFWSYWYDKCISPYSILTVLSKHCGLFPTGSINCVYLFILLQDSESNDQPVTPRVPGPPHHESGSLNTCDWSVKTGHSQSRDMVGYVRAKQAELPSVQGCGTPLDLRPTGRREDVWRSVNQVISLNQGHSVRLCEKHSAPTLRLFINVPKVNSLSKKKNKNCI